jgi:hypothetical protein
MAVTLFEFESTATRARLIAACLREPIPGGFLFLRQDGHDPIGSLALAQELGHDAHVLLGVRKESFQAGA